MYELIYLTNTKYKNRNINRKQQKFRKKAKYYQKFQRFAKNAIHTQ